ncbi:hypothetical protein GGP52_000558 [Salinibacter ruber]|nr:hypothetical protein [Salinibacter ruber]
MGRHIGSISILLSLMLYRFTEGLPLHLKIFTPLMERRQGILLFIL